MNKEYTVYMLVGIPASGKSTLAKRMNADYNIPVVSRDEIRLQITGTRKVFQEREGEISKAFCSCIINKFCNGEKSVIADATHSSIYSRFYFLKNLGKAAIAQNIPEEKIDVIPLVVETSYDICFKRNAARPIELAAPEQEMKEYYLKCKYPSKENLRPEVWFPVRLFYNPENNTIEQYILEDIA